MRWNYLASGSVLLILASLTGAEFLGTTISTDGTVLLSGSGEDPGGSFASRIMAAGASELSRFIEDEQEAISVQGSGPVLFSDYTTEDRISPGTPACVFLGDQSDAADRTHLHASGILKPGTYTMSRVSYPDLDGESWINGSGFILLDAGSEGNTTYRSAGFVSGNMTVHDHVRL